jgi:ubiquinone/menaquinone biosynthesis C-methylase UbiE
MSAAGPESQMADFHFVEDYERLVATLIASKPIDEAMAVAVGGDFERIGRIEAAVVRYAGLRNGMSLIDFGCGSGRLAWALGQSTRIDYLGIDIVQALLDYAATKAPRTYRFLLNRTLRVPAPDASADMVCAFSVFTHLLHTESYIYMQDILRVLRPGGRLVFSFLEFANPQHWLVFSGTVEAQRNSEAPHLNQFIERNVIDAWCAKLGFEREAFIDGADAPWGDAPPLWQAAAILRRP